MKTLEHDTALARSLNSLQVTPALYHLLAAVALLDPQAYRHRLAMTLGLGIAGINFAIRRNAHLFVVTPHMPYDQVTLSQDGIQLLLEIHQRKKALPLEAPSPPIP